MRRAAIVLAGMLLAGCGGAAPVGSVASSEPPAGLGLRYACGQVPFHPAVLAGPGGAENGGDPASTALREFLAGESVEVDGLPDTGWTLVGGTPVLAEFVARDRGGDWAYVGLEQQAGAWQVAGWGGCRPTAFLEGMSLASWTFPPDAAPLGPDSTTFEALVNERACTGGQEMGARLRPPEIAYGPTTVTVIFSATPLPGAHDCPGNPATRVTVRLREPLGDRRLVDGAFFPAADPAAEPQ